MADILDGKYVGPLTKAQTIEQLKYRITIHEHYAALVVQDKRYLNYGSYEFHLWAINGYNEAIRHIKGEKEETMETKKWWESKTVWVNLAMAAGILTQVFTGTAILDAEAQAAIVVVVNLILRLVTGKPLSK